MLYLSPLGQFKIYSYLDFGVFSLTNFSLTAITFVIALFVFLVGGTYSSHNTGSLLKSRPINKALLGLTSFIYGVVTSSLGSKNRSYFSVVLTLFISVFGFNLLGLIPYSFTLTSHLIIALSFSVPVFVAMTGEAIYRHKGAFFSLFLPAGAPVALIPLLTGIEFISYIVRMFSLAIRLAANLIAGHVILKIIASACAGLFTGGATSVVLSILPLSALVIFYCLEFAVAGLQAYVFAVLCCNYLNDGINMGH
ncbi:MAG: ATP synthase F0 subunit A [Sphingobacteriaceae bacterium]|nr:MAG: ATP synthase F0 subunit A [Sphingobacteriaceae bacterium]